MVFRVTSAQSMMIFPLLVTSTRRQGGVFDQAGAGGQHEADFGGLAGQFDQAAQSWIADSAKWARHDVTMEVDQDVVAVAVAPAGEVIRGRQFGS